MRVDCQGKGEREGWVEMRAGILTLTLTLTLGGDESRNEGEGEGEGYGGKSS